MHHYNNNKYNKYNRTVQEKSVVNYLRIPTLDFYLFIYIKNVHCEFTVSPIAMLGIITSPYTKF